MPIAAWNCGVCGTLNAPLDHYATTDCGLTVHPSFAAAVLRRNHGHYGRGLRAVEVSDCLGCPKALAYGMTDYAVDPVKHKPALSGSSWHQEMEDASRWADLKGNGMAAGLVIEQTVHGTINGVQMVGKPDCLVPPIRLIRDWKGKDDAEKAKKYGVDDYIAQQSLYAELVEQDLKWRPTHGIVDFHDHKSLMPKPVPLWDLPTVLEYRPKKGAYGVAELLAMAARVRAGTVTVENIPMYGEEMQMGGGTLCSWCDHRKTCKGIA